MYVKLDDQEKEVLTSMLDEEINAFIDLLVQQSNVLDSLKEFRGNLSKTKTNVQVSFLNLLERILQIRYSKEHDEVKKEVYKHTLDKLSKMKVKYLDKAMESLTLKQ